MARVFLHEPNNRLNEVDRALSPPHPEVEACRASMTNIVEALAEARFEFVMDLESMSESSEFQELKRLVTRTRDRTYKLIQVLGDLKRDSQPLEKARQLLDALARHITLRNHVQVLTGREVSISTDIEALGKSMENILSLLDSYRLVVEETFQKHER